MLKKDYQPPKGWIVYCWIDNGSDNIFDIPSPRYLFKNYENIQIGEMVNVEDSGRDYRPILVRAMEHLINLEKRDDVKDYFATKMIVDTLAEEREKETLNAGSGWAGVQWNIDRKNGKENDNDHADKAGM